MIEPAILVIAPYLPIPADFGGAIRIFNLVKSLSSHQRVILLAPGTRSDARHLDALAATCDVTLVRADWTARQPATMRKRLLQGRSLLQSRSFLELATRAAPMPPVIDRLFQTRNIDLVHYEFTQTAIFAPPVPRPTVIDAHNVEHELLYRVASDSPSPVSRILKSIEARKVRALETRLWCQADLVVATSARDAETIRVTGATTTRVVANGVDASHFAPPDSVPRQNRQIVFTGTLQHEPNAAGIRWYLDHVHPLVLRTCPDSHLTIVGANPPRWLTDRRMASVRVTDRVDDVRPYLWQSSVSIVPLHSGGGTRLKIVESFAAGVPVVSTSVGAEGIDIQHDQHAIIADDPQLFASGIIRLLDDHTMASRMRDNALTLARSRYDWNAIAFDLLESHRQAREIFARRQAEMPKRELNR